MLVGVKCEKNNIVTDKKRRKLQLFLLFVRLMNI